MGYAFSSRCRNREFAAFCTHPKVHADLYPNGSPWGSKDPLVFCPWRKDKVYVKYGSLVFDDTLVWSYHMLIGKVDRANQIILWNKKAEGYSRTTTVHLGAVKDAKRLLPDWAFLPILGLSERSDAMEALQNVYTNLRAEEWPDVRSFMALVKGKTELVEEYIRLNPEQRLAMRGITELANETQTF